MYELRKWIRISALGWWLWLQTLLAHSYCRLRAHLYKLTGTTNRAPRPGDSSISREWIQRLLRSGKHIGADTIVQKVEAEGLDGNRGLVGSMTRVLIQYNSESRKSGQNPASLMLKMSNTHSKFSTRRATIAMGGHREALFYSSDLASSLPQGCLPKIIYSYGSGWLGEFVILMEDIKARNPDAVGVNMLLGNQIWGVPPSIKVRDDPLPLLKMMYAQAAEFHAAFWRDRMLLKQEWMKGVPWHYGQGRARWELALQRAVAAWDRAKERETKSKGGIKFSPKLLKIMDRSFHGQCLFLFLAIFEFIFFLFLLFKKVHGRHCRNT